MTLAILPTWPYSHLAAAHSAVGIGVPDELADTPPRAVFLCPQHGNTSMGGAVWWHLRMRRFQFPVRQRRTAPPSLIGVRWAEKTNRIGAFPMTKRRILTLNPSKARAAYHRACALAALHADSSLATRLSRYNAAMARARALEAQGGAK